MSVARFWRKIPQRYNLIGTKCLTCGRYFYPPRTFCPLCRRDGKIVEHEFSGRGKVITFTVIRSSSDQFEHLTPYVLAIIELEEGSRVTAQVVTSPEEIKIGMQVKRIFRKISTDGESGVIHYGTKFTPL